MTLGFVPRSARLWTPRLHEPCQRIAAVAVQDQAVAQDKVMFMTNFFDCLRKIAPVKKCP